MGKMGRIIGLGLLLAASVSCGSVVRTSRAPVLLVVDSLLGARGKPNVSNFTNTLVSDVLTYIASPAPCTVDSPCPIVFGDPGQVTLRVVPKDIGTPDFPTTPSSNNSVTITRYHVSYRRADGRNTPGIDVPYAFDGAITGTVPGGGNATLGFQLVRSVAKEESPLVQLIKNPSVITTIADVTFYGNDLVGNAISATGSIQVDFSNFGDF